MPIIVILVATLVLVPAYVFAASRIRSSFISRSDKVLGILPDFNCGVCGFKECLDFACSIGSGTGNPAGCLPGGPKTAHALADLLGIEAAIGDTMIATVHCKAGHEARDRAVYAGIRDCHAALLISNGTKTCMDGCLGLGSCVRSCPFDAIDINDNNVAVVNRHKCTGCGTCIAACPRALISLIPHVHKIYLACSNHDQGDEVTASCTAGCTACGECVAVTPSGAISIRNNLPQIDYYTPAENFVAAAYRCPSKCFVDQIKTRPRANIDTKCDGCGDCVGVCPVPGAIIGSKQSRHVIKKDLCIGCGRCLNVCRVRAISLWGSLGYESDSRLKK